MGSLSPIGPPLKVTVRKFTPEDVIPSLKWFGDDKVTITTPNESLRSDKEAQQYFNGTIATHPWYRVICVNEVPAGAIYLTPGVGVHSARADLSYILAQEYWGKGVMSQAVDIALHAGFKDLQLSRIQAFTLLTNIGSQRVLEKSGFKKEGLLRNFVKLRGTVVSVYLFGVCPEDFGKKFSS